MSLRPDHRSGRSRSKSPARSQERSRSHARDSQQHGGSEAPQYQVMQPGQHYAPPPNELITMGNYTDLPPEQRPNYVPPTTPGGITYAQPVQPGSVQYASLPQNITYAPGPTAHTAPTRTLATPTGGFQYASLPSGVSYTSKPVVGPGQASVKHTTQPLTSPHQTPTQPQYVTRPQTLPPLQTSQPEYFPVEEHHRSASLSTAVNKHDGRKIIEMVPGGAGRLGVPPSPGSRPHSLSVGGNRPENLRMDRWSMSGNRPDIQSIMSADMFGGLPPPSPLLEAYHGTYQSISPMPSAVMMDDDLDHLIPLDATSPRASLLSTRGHHRTHSSSRRSPSPSSQPKFKDKLALQAYGHGDDRDRPQKEKRRVRIYDATDDALALVESMSARTVDADIIIDILPALSHDQMLALRSEYKKHCKVQGRGINIAKHIKLKTSGNFGKIAHVTALGKYEGEGYWANYWYQSHSARRELLIEALMGRQNHEIREVKDSFKDKRYGDSLVKCMDKELKADKFRKAVLMALEGKRQEESDAWPVEYKNRDVDTLYKALNAREGGESAMLSIVVMRSDMHLREVLRTYERKYQANFARDALRKSNNLVGEVIAHILNGVINRPARDAMLLHHAFMDLIDPVHEESRSSSKKSSAKDSTSSKHERQQRFELVISRLVRLHWDRLHLTRVKAEYEEKYGRVVEEDIEEATKGDFREFCIALCQLGR